MEIQSRIFFAEEKLKENLERLKKGKSEEQELYSFITQAFSNIEKNAFSGIQIPKRLIPKEYIKNIKLITFGNIISPMLGDYYIL